MDRPPVGDGSRRRGLPLIFREGLPAGSGRKVLIDVEVDLVLEEREVPVAETEMGTARMIAAEGDQVLIGGAHLHRWRPKGGTVQWFLRTQQEATVVVAVLMPAVCPIDVPRIDF